MDAKKGKDAGAGGATPFDLTGIAGPEPNNDKLDLSGILNVRVARARFGGAPRGTKL